jgi:hypothetical protein
MERKVTDIVLGDPELPLLTARADATQMVLLIIAQCISVGCILAEHGEDVDMDAPAIIEERSRILISLMADLPPDDSITYQDLQLAADHVVANLKEVLWQTLTNLCWEGLTKVKIPSPDSSGYVRAFFDRLYLEQAKAAKRRAGIVGTPGRRKYVTESDKEQLNKRHQNTRLVYRKVAEIHKAIRKKRPKGKRSLPLDKAEYAEFTAEINQLGADIDLVDRLQDPYCPAKDREPAVLAKEHDLRRAKPDALSASDRTKTRIFKSR